MEEKKTFDYQTRQEKPRYDSDIIEKWRKALYDAANISGFDLETYNGNRAQMVDKIVQRVLDKMEKIPLHVSPYPTGLDEKIKDLERTVLLQHQRGGARVVGIVGLGGIGKTTLAKEFFNLHRSDYHRSCFLFDVRENAATGFLNKLQMRLLRELTKLNNEEIYNTHEGKAMLTRYLSSSHESLIVLDDVEHIEHLDALLLPIKDVIHSSSLILVTSRNKDVLISSAIPESSIYRLTGLSRQQSQELFCSHAFHRSHPVLGFQQEVNMFLDVCDGLPLSVKVFGALLRGNEDLEYWKAQYREISESQSLPPDIQRSLKISYDSLNPREKQIFLDIACFFIGEDRDTAIRIWDGSSWGGWLGFRNLENKCLVEVDNKNCIRMHDHLRDLGRDIAKNEPGCPLRLWCPAEDLNTQSPVRGIKNLADCSRLGADTSRLQLLSGEGNCVESILKVRQSPQLIWLCLFNCPYSSLPSWIRKKNLRVLKMSEDDLGLETLWQDESQCPDESQVPLQLRELDIAATHLLKIPKSIGQLKYLEKIVLKPGNSGDMKLETLPDEFCHLQSLKHLELNHCSRLKQMPDSFGNLTNLQHILFLSLYSLEMLPDSFGNLRNLQHIRLSDCKELHMLPEAFGKHCTTLQHIDLSGCFKLEMLPHSFWKLTNLQHIDLSYCYNLNMCPNSQTFGNLTQLKYLNMKECKRLSISSKTLGNITTLEYLCLPSCKLIEVLPPQVTHQRSLFELSLLCPRLKELSSDIRELSNLKRLHLGSNILETLPDSMGHLRSLETLELHSCHRLKCLPDSTAKLPRLKKLAIVKMDHLELLEIEECPSSELPMRNVDEEGCMFTSTLTNTRGPRGLHLQLNIQHLKIKDCVHLVEVRALPTTIIKLKLEGCSSLKKIGGLSGLAKLQTIKITLSRELEELLGIETLASLEMLSVGDLKKLNSIQGLGQLKKLRILDIIKCPELKELPSVEDARSLKKLTACECPKLQWGERVKTQLRQRLQYFSID
jgi:Leucine-rich repeat (LRR) protein